MSIHDEINARVAEGRLFGLTPSMMGDAVRRHMFVSLEIQSLIGGPWRSLAAEVRGFQLRAELEAFVRGDQIGICLIPFKAGKAEMGRLYRPADEVWDFRAMRKPGLRVFGRFSERDVFVALTCWPRSVAISWIDRPPLLARDSRQFSDAINGCKTEWRKLFHTYQPVLGGQASDYISEKFDVVGD